MGVNGSSQSVHIASVLKEILGFASLAVIRIEASLMVVALLCRIPSLSITLFWAFDASGIMIIYNLPII